MKTMTRTDRKVWTLKKHGDCAATTVRCEYDRFVGPAGRADVTFHDKGDWTATIRCAGCGKNFHVWGKHIVATVNASKVCDGRCWNARNGDCDCSCSGDQHGMAHQVNR